MSDIYILKSVTNTDGSPKINPMVSAYIGKQCEIDYLISGRRATLSFRFFVSGNLVPYLITSKVKHITREGNNITFETKNSVYTLGWRHVEL